MSISLAAMLVSVLSASLLMGFLSTLILCKNFVSYIKPQYLLLCAIFIIMRCFLPYEFFYTITLKSRNILPFIQRIRHMTLGGEASVGQILIFVWIIVALLKLFLLLLKQYRIEQNIERFPISKKMPELSKLLCQKNISSNIQLVEIPHLSTPALVGFRNPRIIIPSDMPEGDLHYILLHELEHYKHRDLNFIALLHLLCIIYWWNPAVYLLKYSMLKVIEYRVDAAVIQQLGEDGKVNYLQSILNVVALKNKRELKASFGIGLHEKKSDLYQRFCLILENKSKNRGHCLPKFVLAMVILSTVVIFEPYSIPVKDAANTFDVNSDCFLVERNGVYELYRNDMLYLTVDRKDGFENLPIYKED